MHISMHILLFMYDIMYAMYCMLLILAMQAYSNVWSALYILLCFMHWQVSNIAYKWFNSVNISNMNTFIHHGERWAMQCNTHCIMKCTEMSTAVLLLAQWTEMTSQNSPKIYHQMGSIINGILLNVLTNAKYLNDMWLLL